jgi:uncharacterized membrane protein YjfL (UPF0719 family)
MRGAARTAHLTKPVIGRAGTEIREVIMEMGYLKANFIHLLMNIVYAHFALFVGMLAFRFIDKVVFPEINFMDEIKKGNIAASVFCAAIFFFVAMIVGMSMA